MQRRETPETSRAPEPPQHIQAVVFDCDGLLLDTEKLWMRGEAELVGRYGAEYTPEVRERLFGVSAAGLGPALEEILGRPGEGEALVRELVSYCWEEISRNAEPRPGAVGLVEALLDQDGRTPLGVASNSPRGLVEEALQTAGLYEAFDVVVGYEDVRQPKPGPEPYLLCCERLDADPAHSVALEDSPTGAASARAAGLYVIGVPSEPGIPLEAHQTAVSLHDPAVHAALGLPGPEAGIRAGGPHTPHKFDPARASRLEDPDRQRFLPNARILELLDLSGSETVVDYGAGSGVLTAELGRALPHGTVHAVEENPEMYRLLEERISDSGLVNVGLHEIRENRVPLPDGCAGRVLAVNLLHEVVGESAPGEMRRLLKPDGALLVVDWRSDVDRDEGPPRHVTFDPEGARRVLEDSGFLAEPVAEGEFPYHLALLARKRS
ncbi:HAD-IA family hydrolase [Rubrobacter aplysinae]|uniref:HAD-IA family hydrolase n=1 Tax=Rubrobacter aplysinae TaxID=909625 RepID=UPI000B00DD44|nr:HAD-IA family hydrolase [Rubrobacter aplysinae]